ncbi:MAG: hypothetical protein N3F07_03755 [Candidatus Micrarchaeota archaeon]|nr:hypothetical protein [Candidatus Micrarchaeota archaeon]
MKTPIPEEDIRSGQMGKETKRKLSEGKITELDFEVAQILYKINERRNISAASFRKALDFGSTALILTEGEAGVLIGKDGKIVSEISSALGKKVRIVEVGKDIRKTVSDVIAPARLLGINRVFHQGREIAKVRLPKTDLARLPIDITCLEKALRELMEEEVKLEFE